VPGTLKPDFLQILRTLTLHGVDFILVGGVAAAVQGAPIMTFDVDVLYSTGADDLGRLLAAVETLEGYYRTHPERRLKPQLAHLAAAGHNLLSTRFGPLDLLGSIGNAHSYLDLLPHANSTDVGDGITVRVLDLETLIAVKEEVAGEKDKAVLPILRRTLDESRRK
jgi:predicted nucleotidyltransferase